VAAVSPAAEETVSAVPVITKEIIDGLLDMNVTELLATFPATYQPEYSASDIKRGGFWRDAHWADIATWDLRVTAAHGTTMFANGVYMGMVQFDHSPRRAAPADPTLQPDMAASWEWNGDGTKLTFTIQDEMYWGDLDNPFEKGPKVVGEDIVYVLTEYKDNSVQGGNYRTVTNITSPDDRTVVMEFSAPSFWLLPFMASKDASIFNPHLAKAGRMGKEMIGPGPWVMVEAKKNINVRMARNPHYVIKDPDGGALPYIDSVNVMSVPEASTRLAMLRTGATESSSGVASNQRGLQALLRTNPDLNIQMQPGTGVGTTLSMQMDNPMWADANLRRALQLATDNKGISDTLYTGMGMPGDKIDWYYWTDEAPTWDSDLDALYGEYNNHYDLDKAKELFAAAGHSELTIELPFYAYRQANIDHMALIADDWRKLGVKAKVQSQDYSDYNSTLQRATQKDIIAAWNTFGYDVIGLVSARVHSTSPGNRENVNDPVIDGLIDTLTLTQDPAKQRELVQQIRAQYNDQIYWVTSPTSAASISNTFQGYIKGVRAGTVGTGGSLGDYAKLVVLREAWFDQ
jgi:ABC-type transport system substrate-binding protein